MLLARWMRPFRSVVEKNNSSTAKWHGSLISLIAVGSSLAPVNNCHISGGMVGCLTCTTRGVCSQTASSLRNFRAAPNLGGCPGRRRSRSSADYCGLRLIEQLLPGEPPGGEGLQPPPLLVRRMIRTANAAISAMNAISTAFYSTLRLEQG